MAHLGAALLNIKRAFIILPIADRGHQQNADKSWGKQAVASAIDADHYERGSIRYGIIAIRVAMAGRRAATTLAAPVNGQAICFEPPSFGRAIGHGLQSRRWAAGQRRISNIPAKTSYREI